MDLSNQNRTKSALNKSSSKTEIKPYVIKSNLLITAKFKFSLLANKLMAMAINKIDEDNTATLSPSDIKYILGDDRNIYRKMKDVSHTLVGNTICIKTSPNYDLSLAVIGR